MVNNNIFKSLLNDDNVNDYTKLYLILYQMNYYQRHYIPNKLISNRLNLKIPNCTRLLKRLEKNNIIKITYIGKKRYFKFINNIKTTDYEEYNWLDSDFN